MNNKFGSKRLSSKFLIGIPVAIIIIALVVLIVRALLPSETVISGMIEINEIDVASKIPGRIDTIFVHEGEHVVKGQVLAHLESKEMDAKVEQARGLMEAARAKYEMALHGARPEEREAVEKLFLQASHQYELAEKTWNRINVLYKDSVVSTQEKDQIEFQYKAAKEQMEAARAKYDMVVKGTRQEEIDGARSLFHQAENGYKEALAYAQELNMVSPCDGEIEKLVSDPGEIISSGYPVITMINRQDAYAVLHVREDLMPKVKMHDEHKVTITALGDKPYTFAVTYISPMGEFTTWKPTKQKGEFDLKTFEVHLRSSSPIENLRPGMSVNISF
jgi:HlyD family secretion protein